jgi:hypothetical protein
VNPRIEADITLLAADAITVELSDGQEIRTPTGDFEPVEHGVQIGRKLIPWHRVVRYSWPLASGDFAEEKAGHVRARVRLVVHGQEHVVPADRFETGPWTVTVIVDEVVDADSGTVSRTKLFVPWAHVDEYERMPVDDTPPRVDE